MVWGQTVAGVNVASGFPPPPWPNAVGVASLALGEVDDIALFWSQARTAENNITGNLMLLISIRCPSIVTTLS